MGEMKQKTTKPSDYVGSGKSCPMYGSPHHFSFCRNDCEWNDGEGCAVWRIVKALEGTKERLGGIQNALAELNTEIQQRRR
jgi:hypothetical protein